MSPYPKLVNLGVTDYVSVYQRMLLFSQNRQVNSPDEFWFCEHNPVYTLGASQREEGCGSINNIPVIQTDRGGKITFHGPGQLVCYPLIDLKRKKIYPKTFLLLLEQILLNTLDSFEIQGIVLKNYPGLYVERAGGIGRFSGLAKIASIGLKITNKCTYHGFAINVDMDLRPFSFINPCGYEGLRLVNLKELCPSADIVKVNSVLSQQILDIFK